MTDTQKPSAVDSASHFEPKVSLVMAAKVGETVVVPKDATPPPAEQGFRRSLGLIKGQLKDWRLALDSGPGIHVREYADRYEVHVDNVDPSKGIVQHLAADTPITLLFISGLAGAVAAHCFKKHPLAGALIGVAASEILRTRKV